jgi:hypothetical protein
MCVIRFNINSSALAEPTQRRRKFHTLLQVATVSLNRSNRLVFVKETSCVLCELELKFYI